MFTQCVARRINRTSGKRSLGKLHRYNQNTHAQIWNFTEILTPEIFGLSCGSVYCTCLA